MRSRIYLSIAVGVFLSTSARYALAGGTSLVYVYGGNFNLGIPADPAATRGWMQDAVVIVPDHSIICDLDVRVTIRHGAAFDLGLYLKGPGGRIVTLSVSDPFGGYYEGQDYDSTVFDDEADVGIAEGDPPFTGSFRPFEPLSVFDGCDAYGPWALRVYDAYYADTGYLESFALVVTVSSPDTPAPAPVGVPVPGAGGLVLAGMILIGRHRRALSRDARSRSQGRFVRTMRRPSPEPSAPAPS